MLAAALFTINKAFSMLLLKMDILMCVLDLFKTMYHQWKRQRIIILKNVERDIRDIL